MSRRGKDPSEGSQWAVLVGKIKSHDKQKKEVDQLLHQINRTRERVIGRKEEFNQKLADKLKKTYVDAGIALKKQQNLLAQAQESVAVFLSLSETPVATSGFPVAEAPASQDVVERRRKYDITLPLPVAKSKPLPPLCGPIPAPANYSIPAESLVAAKTSPGAEWILAVVVRKIGNGRYEVMDCEEVEQGDKAVVHQVPAKHMVPLPTTLPDPKLKVEFSEGTSVLALYPSTTCFYKAQVVMPPSKDKDSNYLVLFEEEEEQEGGGVPHFAVPPRLVLAAPSEPKGSKK